MGIVRVKQLLEAGNAAVDKLIGESTEEQGELTEGKDIHSFMNRHNFDEEQRRHFRALCMVAENDGRSYHKKDAEGAVNKASRGYIRNEIADLQADVKVVGPMVEEYLRTKWAREK